MAKEVPSGAASPVSGPTSRALVSKDKWAIDMLERQNHELLKIINDMTNELATLKEPWWGNRHGKCSSEPPPHSED